MEINEIFVFEFQDVIHFRISEVHFVFRYRLLHFPVAGMSFSKLCFDTFGFSVYRCQFNFGTIIEYFFLTQSKVHRL